MPELPEVETVKRGLEPVMSGTVLELVEVRRADLRFPFPERFAERLKGQRVEMLVRRSKYLLARLSDGQTLVIHLGMSGRITIVRPFETEQAMPNPAHDHVVFHLQSGTVIRYNDPRRFGFMTLIDTNDLDDHKLFKQLGPEPLGNQFHAAHLATRARGRKTPLKSFLLDQKTVAGLGNIYVCEALFRAGLSPQRMALSLTRKNGQPTQAAERLCQQIRAVLREAIDKGGSSLRDHRLTDGSLGYFQHEFKVYGRTGEACARPGCPGLIKRTTQSGRSTFSCPQCQR